jgi:hypothetical protein
MISTKYVSAVSALMACVLVPTVMHTYIGARRDDGRTAGAINSHLGDLRGVDTGRQPAWAGAEFASGDFIERRYGRDLTLLVVRSYDAKRLYHHPELVAAYGQDFASSRVVRFDVRPEVPVHVLSGASRSAAYALVYGGGFVEDPIRFQIVNAVSLMLRPRELMTLFFVHGTATTERLSSDTPTIALLLESIRSFETQSAAASSQAPD